MGHALLLGGGGMLSHKVSGASEEEGESPRALVFVPDCSGNVLGLVSGNSETEVKISALWLKHKKVFS